MKHVMSASLLAGIFCVTGRRCEESSPAKPEGSWTQLSMTVNEPDYPKAKLGLTVNGAEAGCRTVWKWGVN